MEYLSKAYVCLSISGRDFDVNHFNSINPQASRVGENSFGEKFWEYKINSKNANEGLDDAIETLISNFTPIIEEIKNYISGKDVYIKVFIVIQSLKNEDNGVFISRNFLKFLYELGAEIEIDVYNE